MTRDEIIKMAREAGFDQSNPHEALIVRHSNGSWIGITNRLERFAAIVAAAGREACARVCDQIAADRWALYKGRPPYNGSEDGRACQQTRGEA